jgi:class 3 adenylate cyclase
MASDPQPQLDFAHVLYVDLVGYSKLLMEQQFSLIRELTEIVQGTTTYQKARPGEDIIVLPTGDGMALAFFGSPTAPAECAVEITMVAQQRPHVSLRMGIHSGPVYHVSDINANLNISGGGINIAQRVMDCGDDGHILVSRTVADVLAQLSRWTSHLSDLGDVEVKHGVRVHLYNLHTEGFGNADVPVKLAAAAADTNVAHDPPSTAPVPLATALAAAAEASRAPTVAPPPPAAAAAPSVSGLRVALLYKREVAEDERMLAAIERRLVKDGATVFIDRHLDVGLEWATEIERQIRGADAVVPLISGASIHSEMLSMELRIAHEAAQEQDGRPRILPLRVAYDGPLPQEMADILDPIQYALWESPDDDDEVLDQLMRALSGQPMTPPAAEPVAPAIETAPSASLPAVPDGDIEFHPAGGAMPLTSGLYIERRTDAEVYTALNRRDSIVLIKGARQMGKTSLLARGLQHARDAGFQVIRTDMQKLNSAQLESPEELYMALGEDIADQLDLDVFPEDVWRPRRGPSTNFDRYISREVLRKTDTQVVWALDEVDRLFTCPFASEVFALFRTWHNERSLDPTGPWIKLTCLIAYATEAHLFITDVNQSPFNVGTRLELDDFSFEQVSELNTRCGSPLINEGEVARYTRLVGGSPYLVHRGLQEMMNRELDLNAFEADVDRDSGIFGDHLRRMLVLLARDEELSEVVRTILRGKPMQSPTGFYRLRSAGLMVGDSARDVRPRCDLYARYLERHLL